MSAFEHIRFAVFNISQHPYRHSLAEFIFSNPILPDVQNVEEALNYIVGFMYPNSIGSFATMAALLIAVPVPSLNDYAFIQDDGDGKAAGYVYQKVNGITGWNKRYDVDWSMEAILAETINRTQYQYVHKYGMTDRAADGLSDLAGVLSGQHIYGGDLATQNLTLHANSADVLGTITGFIQLEATTRPTDDATFDLGHSSYQWRDLRLSRNALIGTLTVTAARITDSTGAISFDNENLTTTGSADSQTRQLPDRDDSGRAQRCRAAGVAG